MDEQKIPSLIAAFTELPDPRDRRGVRHLPVDVVTIGVLAVICGAHTFTGLHQYAIANEGWRRGFLALPFGVPSQDTSKRIFAVLPPEAWQSRFLAWAQTLGLPDLPPGQNELLAIEGVFGRSVSGYPTSFTCQNRQNHVTCAKACPLGMGYARTAPPDLDRRAWGPAVRLTGR